MYYISLYDLLLGEIFDLPLLEPQTNTKFVPPTNILPFELKYLSYSSIPKTKYGIRYNFSYIQKIGISSFIGGVRNV